jgi:hypothetical protein
MRLIWRSTVNESVWQSRASFALPVLRAWNTRRVSPFVNTAQEASRSLTKYVLPFMKNTTCRSLTAIFLAMRFITTQSVGVRSIGAAAGSAAACACARVAATVASNNAPITSVHLGYVVRVMVPPRYGPRSRPL